MLVLCDVDSVIADLMPAWLGMYNKDFDDDLSIDDITNWDMTKFVKPECGKQIYKYLERSDLYDSVLMIDVAWEGVQYIRKLGHRVVFATSGVHTVSKFEWLRQNDFNPGTHAEDYVVIYDKTLLRGDLLIDDRDENILNFNRIGGHTILFSQPWNTKFEWHKRAYDWYDVIRIVEEKTYK